MNAQTKLTSADIERGQQAALQELEDARAAHSKCAYAHAIDRDDAAAKQALIQSKQRLDLLEAELQGLSAATGEAQRRERHAMLLAQIEQLGRDATDAKASTLKAKAAFAKAAAAITAAGQALMELEEAEREANRKEIGCSVQPQGARFPTGSLRSEGLVGALLWLEIGERAYVQRSGAVMDVGGQKHPERPLEWYAKDCEKSIHRVEHGTRARVEALEQEAAKLA